MDAICDGTDVFVPGIMEHVERTGIHSGDSISVYPTFSVSRKAKGDHSGLYSEAGLGIGIVGLYNIQFIVDKQEQVYVIEVNPRSSPGRCLSCPRPRATPGGHRHQVILGESLESQGYTGNLSRRAAALLREGPGLTPSPSCGGWMPVPGDEVHRRGHRL